MTDGAPTTVTELMAVTSQLLTTAGYRVVPSADALEVTGTLRVFEDVYGVVGVAVFDTFGELRAGWTDAQGLVVDLMSRAMVQSEAKAWDGYLLLLTPGTPDLDGEAEVEAIRGDTVRLRKLVATGADLTQATDVERTLLPLLPLGPELIVHEDTSSVLASLPSILADKDVPAEATLAVLQAFKEQRPLLEGVHGTVGK